MFKRDKAAVATSVETLIGPAVTLRGDLDFSGGLHLEGRVFGNVRVIEGTRGTLALSEGAVIEGEVHAQQAVVHGRVRGDIHIDGRLALGPKAVVEGSVRYGTIEMAAGARITGKLLRSVAATSTP